MEVQLLSEFTVQTGFILLGALGLLSIFVLLFFLQTRERIYLYYFSFLIFSFLMTLFYFRSAALIHTFFQVPKLTANILVEVFTLWAFGAYCLFSIRLLKVKKQNKDLYYWIQALAWGVLLYGLLYLLWFPASSEWRYFAFRISRVVIISGSVIGLIWIIVKIKSPVKLYFVVGSCLYLFGAVLAILRAMTSDLLPPGFYRFHSQVYFLWGIFLEVVSFTLALGLRVYFGYEERQKDQQQSYSLAVYEKEKAQAEALAMKIQINPHFLFNYLNVIKYYIQKRENATAENYLVKFSRLIRSVLQISQTATVPLSQEFDLIRQYLSLEEIRFKEDFKYKINTGQNIPFHKILIPPMLLQPFVEYVAGRIRRQNNACGSRMDIEVNAEHDTLQILLMEDTLELPQPPEGNQVASDSNELDRKLISDRIEWYNRNHLSKIDYAIEETPFFIKKNKALYVKIEISDLGNLLEKA